MDFKILSEIAAISVVARGRGVDARAALKRKYGGSRWRKLKGIATVQLEDERICRAELHWYEAQGVGRRDIKLKHELPD